MTRSREGRTFSDARPSAGLPLSVGAAPLSVRLVIAFVFLLTAAVCIAGGVFVASSGSRLATFAAIVLIEPIGIVGLIAVAFIAAPHSRFGVWLDHFVPRLRETGVAVATAVVVGCLGAAIVFASR